MTIYTEASEYLEKHIHKGDTIFIVPKRILRGGKSLEIAVLIKHPELGIVNVSEFIAMTSGINQYKVIRNTSPGLSISAFYGCEFHVVNNLSYYLFDEAHQLISKIL
jgi:hypothetical protein